jgi:hypothetical protein
MVGIGAPSLTFFPEAGRIGGASIVLGVEIHRPLGLGSQHSSKIALIPEEMAQKKDDLFKKYSIKVKIELSGAMLIGTPAVKLYCKAAVGRHKKIFTLFYNPIDKSLDPLVRDDCGHDAVVVHFCGQFHLLCPRCIQHCPVC